MTARKPGRLLVSAAGSGMGKSVVTMSLLQAMKERGILPRSFKCGPDYIDPRFHERVLGVPCRNLDTYLMGEDEVLAEMNEAALDGGGPGDALSVAEGAMGLFDGLGGGIRHSAYYIAALCGMPVLVVLDAARKEVSCAAQLDRLLDRDAEGLIRGVLINRCGSNLYAKLLPELQKVSLRHGRPLCGDAKDPASVVLCGFLPPLPEAVFPSRHLGLVGAAEAEGFAQRVHVIAGALERAGCVDAVLSLMRESTERDPVNQVKSDIQSVELTKTKPDMPSIDLRWTGSNMPSVELTKMKSDMPSVELTKTKPDMPSVDLTEVKPGMISANGMKPVSDEADGSGKVCCTIAVARDEAFSFLYQRSLDNLEKAGARLCFFSPVHDRDLPAGADGLYLPGGYPELYAASLEENASMRHAVKLAVMSGMPTVAECGGFLYLGAQLSGEDGNVHNMCGALPGIARRQERLVRFGYLELTKEHVGSLLFEPGETVRAHEFHYWDSTCCGTDLLAIRRTKNQTWRCGFAGLAMYAAFPHIYLNQERAKRFVCACEAFHNRLLVTESSHA